MFTITVIFLDWLDSTAFKMSQTHLKSKHLSNTFAITVSIGYTHFLKACLTLSELYTQMKKHTHNGQNPSLHLQNETLHSKQCFFFQMLPQFVFTCPLFFQT